MGDVSADLMSDYPSDSVHRVPDHDGEGLIPGLWGRRISGRIIKDGNAVWFILRLDVDEDHNITEHYVVSKVFVEPPVTGVYQEILDAMTARLEKRWAEYIQKNTP